MHAVDRLPTVSLAELNEQAALLTRVDRKYVIATAELDAALTGIPGLRVLEIDGRRASRYESTYLDTVDLDSWTSSAHQRRRRWKVRTRVYADTGECWLEVKTRGRRGATVKERLPHEDRLPEISDASGEWVRGRLGAAQVHGVDPRGLVPTLRTSYLRTTLLLGAGADAGRVTVDRDLRWVSGHGTAEVGDVLVVETKSGTVRPGPLDRRLWELGHRPTRISKYGTGLALLTPDLQRNRWHRVTSQHLAAHVTLRPGGAQLTAGNSFIAWSAIFFIMKPSMPPPTRPPATGMPRPKRESTFSLTPRINRKPTALLTTISAAGGRPLRAYDVTRLLAVAIPAFLSTSSESEPTRVSRTAVRTRGSLMSYPRRVAMLPTIRTAWR